MNQEDLNAMMRNPWERKTSTKTMLPQCPRCGEHYCGDGVQPCLECAALQGESQ